MIKIMDWGEKRRYEEPRPIYLDKHNIGGMNECHEEDGDFTAIWTKEERPVVFLVKETPEEILAMPDIEEGNKTIDWEQRRYEIAKDIMAAIYTRPNVKGTLLNYNQIVAAADGLIRELKKGTEQ